jgi:hypothetical protein
MADKTVATPAHEGQVMQTRPADKFRAYMLERASRESSTDSSEVSANQVDKILSAVNEDDIWDADQGGTIQGKDVIGIVVEIRSMRMQASDRFDGSPYYANLDVTCLGGPAEVLARASLSVGESFVLQTGAELIIAKVRAFEAHGKLPLVAMIAGTRTSSGFDVLKLARPPSGTVTSTTE